MEYSSIFVCLMGMGTVFFGLDLPDRADLSHERRGGPREKGRPGHRSRLRPRPPGEVTPELVAAVSAALAEELGTDITGIRIVSMKKV